MNRVTVLTVSAALLVPVSVALDTARPESAPAVAAPAAIMTPAFASSLAALGPDEMTTVIVTMRDKADLVATRRTRRRDRLVAVVKALRSEATTSQAGLRVRLRALMRAGQVAEFRPLWVLNAISVTATADAITQLAKRPDVQAIEPDAIDVIPATGPPEPNLTAVGAPAVWDAGSTGQGVVIASLDSGVDMSHPDLASRWRGGTNSWFDPYGEHVANPTDMTGHGTGTMGVMVGGDAEGASIGTAPGATWIAARVFDDRGRSTATAIHAAFQWLLDPDGDPNTADAPNVVNGSWSYGSGGTCNTAFRPDVQALDAAGIVSVFAAETSDRVGREASARRTIRSRSRSAPWTTPVRSTTTAVAGPPPAVSHPPRTRRSWHRA